MAVLRLHHTEVAMRSKQVQHTMLSDKTLDMLLPDYPTQRVHVEQTNEAEEIKCND